MRSLFIPCQLYHIHQQHASLEWLVRFAFEIWFIVVVFSSHAFVFMLIVGNFCVLFWVQMLFPSLICRALLFIANFYGGPLPSLRFHIVTSHAFRSFFSLCRRCVLVLMSDGIAATRTALVWLSDYYSLIVSHWISRVFLFTTCCAWVSAVLLSDSRFLSLSSCQPFHLHSRAPAFWLVRNCYCFGYYWRLLCFNNNVKKMRTHIMRCCSLFRSLFSALSVPLCAVLIGSVSLRQHFKVLLVRNFPKTALMLSNTMPLPKLSFLMEIRCFFFVGCSTGRFIRWFQVERISPNSITKYCQSLMWKENNVFNLFSLCVYVHFGGIFTPVGSFFWDRFFFFLCTTMRS